MSRAHRPRPIEADGGRWWPVVEIIAAGLATEPEIRGAIDSRVLPAWFTGYRPLIADADLQRWLEIRRSGLLTR